MIRQGWSTLKKLMFAKTAAGGGTAVEATATGNPLTFVTDLARPLKSLLIPFTTQQEGSGDPSPENVRPILPWNGLKVFGSGKNIVTDDFTNGVLSLETGKVTYNPQFVVSGFIPVKPLTSYYFRCPTVDKTELDIVYYDKDKQYIGYTDADGYSSCNTPGRSRKTPAGCYYVRIDARNAQYNNDICINYPASVTGYVPAVGITDTDIVFPSPVYGGTLDVVSGVLTVTHEGLVSTWGQAKVDRKQSGYQQGRMFFTHDVPVSGQSGASATNQKCNIAKYQWDDFNGTPHFYTGTLEGRNCAVILIPEDTPDETEIVVSAKLRTTYEVQLTPAQITAIVGDNTIWSDADGSMTAVYLVSEAYAEDHPVGGLSSGLGSGLLGSNPDPEEPIEDPEENPEE